MASGTVDVEEYAIDLDDVGRLNMSFGFSGYTLAFIKSMQETVKAQAANPNKEQADQAASLAMLGLMQQLSSSTPRSALKMPASPSARLTMRQASRA